MQLDFNASKPIYQQIIDEIKKAIARGELVPGDKLPSQRDLAEMARVNQNTVQRAYRELELTGVAETVRGQGTFVSNDPKAFSTIQDEMVREALHQFIREMYSLGFSDEQIVELVAKECGKVSANIRNGKPAQLESERGERL